MKFDIAFNFIAAVCVAAVAFFFTPVYVRYLGLEWFGLVGLLATLQFTFGVLDGGMSQVLTRELSRYLGGATTAQSIRNLVRSIETIAFSIAAMVTLCIALSAEWIAAHWLNTDNLPRQELVIAIRLMGALVALRLLESLYRAAAVGLQRMTQLNIIIISASLLRGFGALAIFVTLSNSIVDFFIWQICVSAAMMVFLILVLHGNLPRGEVRAYFSLDELRRVARFSIGLTAISALSVVLSQTDKLLLSKLLPLQGFSEYALAATLAAAPYIFAFPIKQAVQPRFARAVAQNDKERLALALHGSTQLLTVLLGSATAVIVFFSQEALSLWLHDEALAARIAPLTSVLAVGSMLHGLLWLPYALQFAHGWTGLVVRANFVAALILIPGLFVAVPIYGAMSAAWFWVAINFALFTIMVFLMFRVILPEHKTRWYVVDVLLPLAVATIIAMLVKWLAPAASDVWTRLLLVGTAACLTLAGAALAAPIVRTEAMKFVHPLRKNTGK